MNPLLHLPPEAAHNAAIWALKNLPNLWQSQAERPRLRQSLWGLDFPNCLGLAAGFDKHAEVYNPLFKSGFGFVEVGSITPRPQPGNAKPRVFRLEEDQAVINRYGFNSHGHQLAGQRLADRPAQGLLGLNFGKNKDTEEAAADYTLGIRRLAQHASYLVINVSSPNTPGLRAEQAQERLRPLVRACIQARAASGARRKPMLIKIAPDMSPDELEAVVELSVQEGVEGLIVSNTTIDRPESLIGTRRGEAGGLSGKPLTQRSTEVLRFVASQAAGRLVLIGVGGVHDGKSAYDKILAGASLVQLYTAMAYEGLGLVPKIQKELEALLMADGFDHISQAIGKGI